MNKWLFISFAAFAGGIALRSFFDFGIYFSILLIILGVVFLLIRHSNILPTSRNATNGQGKNVGMSYAVAGLVLLSFGFGVLRYDVSDVVPPLQEFVGGESTITGVVVDEPDIRENHTKLTFKVEHIGNKDVAQTVKVLLIVKRYPQFEYGDYISVTGKLLKPENFSGSDTGRVFDPFNKLRVNTEQGRSIDYVSYLKKDGIYYQMFYPKIELIGHDKGNPVKAFLFETKQSLTNSISQAIPEPHASLLGGIVFGAKHSLGKELLDAFRAVGIIHIVVLSGYNVTIVAEWIGRLVSFAPRAVALSLSALGIVGFTVMTGAGATIVRASMMALLVLLARATGRLYEITTALIIAAFIMLLHNPHILIFDASFQLSFLATVGLIYLAPRIEHLFSFVPKKFGLREFATATIATQIFVLPLLLYMTGQLSLVSLPVNMLILVFIPLTMLFGFLTGVFGIISFYLSLPFAFIAYLLLSYELSVVTTFNALPLASITISNFPFWLALCMYIVYGIGIYLLNKQS